ncbi:MAG: glutamine-synthetase adenylyltransferase, partial [Arenimonas sp.]|nr:glutamine-synthetase adenylyltransferase [Arenimonas sp.]
MSSELESGLQSLVERSLVRLGQACPGATADPARRERLAKLALASDFAVETLVRQPGFLDRLDAPATAPPSLDPAREADWPGQLRRWRAAESTRLIWRDVHGLDSVEDTLAGSSWIAEQALAVALEAVSGVVR